MPGRIYISFGLPKSASSFVSQMCIRAAQLHSTFHHKKLFQLHDLVPGCVNELCADVACEMMEIKYSNNTLYDLVSRLLQNMSNMDTESLLVLKTHLGCSAELAKLVEDGSVLASATYRHPVDMLLSRVDMAEREKEKDGLEVFLHYYKSLYIPQFMSWAEQPNVPKFYYDDVLRHPDRVARVIASQFKLTIDPEELFDSLLRDKSQIWQFNKGVLDRRHNELAEHEIASIESHFVEFIRYIDSVRKCQSGLRPD